MDKALGAWKLRRDLKRSQAYLRQHRLSGCCIRFTVAQEPHGEARCALIAAILVQRAGQRAPRTVSCGYEAVSVSVC
jgi:hypothetical protein